VSEPEDADPPPGLPVVTTWTAVHVNSEGSAVLPDQLVMIRAAHNGVVLAEVVVESGYRLVVDANGVRGEPIREWQEETT
jgi:hypothetical protein